MAFLRPIFICYCLLGNALELWVDYSYVIADIKRSAFCALRRYVDTCTLYIYIYIYHSKNEIVILTITIRHCIVVSQ